MVFSVVLFHCRFQMLTSILILLGVAVALYVAHLLLKAYLNKPLQWETFQAQKQAAPSTPAEAVPVEKAEPEPPRVVAPSGPNPPNAQAPPEQPPMPPPEKTRPMDPYDDTNSETPIRDNLRQPENSFGPGVENNGTMISVQGGISSEQVNKGVSQFSPEFAQNGGEFMNGIFATDTYGTDNYATI